MTREEIELAAREVSDAALKKVRDDFQTAHPHYMPPPWNSFPEPVWERWYAANVALHGKDGCHARFPITSIVFRRFEDE